MNSRNSLLQRTIFVLAMLTVKSTFAANDVSPTDVYYEVQKMAVDIQLVSKEMGIDGVEMPSMSVTGAQPREVYFQALTLFKKANRLLFEQMRQRQPELAERQLEITPADVMHVVQQSHAIIQRVKTYLSITEISPEIRQREERTPTDVFKLIVDQNRSLNRLLQQRFAPGDVYQRLTHGVGLMSTVLASFDIEPVLGNEPDFVRQKTPTQVYASLAELYNVIHKIIALAGGQCLIMGDEEQRRKDLVPSDVYDMASIVSAQLRYLHVNRKDIAPMRKSYYPGDKLPSHVYQRAGRLRSQVELLLQYTKRHPNWLK